jgi:hypothetical protein
VVGSSVGADVLTASDPVSPAVGSAGASDAAVEIGVGDAFAQAARLAIMSIHTSKVNAVFVFIANPPVMKHLTIFIYNGNRSEIQPSNKKPGIIKIPGFYGYLKYFAQLTPASTPKSQHPATY